MLYSYLINHAIHLEVSVKGVHADVQCLLQQSKLSLHLDQPVDQHSSVPGLHLRLSLKEPLVDGVALLSLQLKQVLVDVPHVLLAHLWVISILWIHVLDISWHSVNHRRLEPLCLLSLMVLGSSISFKFLAETSGCLCLHHFWGHFPVANTYNISFIRGNLWSLFNPTTDWNSWGLVLNVNQSRSLFCLLLLHGSRLKSLVSDHSESPLYVLACEGSRTVAQCSRHLDSLSSPN